MNAHATEGMAMAIPPTHNIVFSVSDRCPSLNPIPMAYPANTKKNKADASIHTYPAVEALVSKVTFVTLPIPNHVLFQ
jgi:hypothetical protein